MTYRSRDIGKDINIGVLPVPILEVVNLRLPLHVQDKLLPHLKGTLVEYSTLHGKCIITMYFGRKSVSRHRWKCLPCSAQVVLSPAVGQLLLSHHRGLHRRSLLHLLECSIAEDAHGFSWTCEAMAGTHGTSWPQSEPH
jgi:hypothetical protein